MNGQILESPRFVDAIETKTHPDDRRRCEKKKRSARATFGEMKNGAWAVGGVESLRGRNVLNACGKLSTV